MSKLELKSSHEHYTNQEAYEFLLKIICGLESKLIGEYEIVSQFKKAYIDYCEFEAKCNKTLLILEKLFKDAKEIRTKYLLGLGQKTYAAITREIIMQSNNSKDVLILGSGSLAKDMINQLKKKKNITLSARNQIKLMDLSTEHNLQSSHWSEYFYYLNFKQIINTTSVNIEKLLPKSFISKWNNKFQNGIIIDLSKESTLLNLDLTNNKIITLSDIFQLGAIKEESKKNKLKLAEIALKEIVEKRNSCLNQKLKMRDKYLGKTS